MQIGCMILEYSWIETRHKLKKTSPVSYTYFPVLFQ